MQFCQRLARDCLGQVSSDAHTARLGPLSAEDAQRACALCRQYGVQLALYSHRNPHRNPPPNPPANQSILWLDPAIALTRLEPLKQTPGCWRAEAGVRLGALQAAGLTQLNGAPADMTLAHWLAGPASALCATGATSVAGIISLEVLLADGTRATFGPFGPHATEPLRGATVQGLIPQLFELARSRDADQCCAHPHWLPRARLDALRADEANLAHLLLGHGGTLAWIEAAVLSATPHLDAHPLASLAAAPELLSAAARLDAAVKRLFDPNGLFGRCKPGWV